MNIKKYNWILYLITATIITTIAVQFYWNYKHYEQNKQRVINEVQISLDNAVEEYYIGLTKLDFTFVNTKEDSVSFSARTGIVLDSISTLLSEKDLFKKNTSDKNTEFEISQINISTDEKGEQINYFTNNNTKFRVNENGSLVIECETPPDNLGQLEIKTFFISIKKDVIEYDRIDSLLQQQLSRKKINISYVLNHYKADTLFSSYDKVKNAKELLFVNSKSTYLDKKEKLELGFSNSTFEALKRSFTGILLSLLLSIAVIASLFYLLYIINKQKELAEIKNDLISNITHEFKTPITTVSAALEAIENFNALEDKEKTLKYLSISSVHIKKLNQMVEKLLETATLDSEKLMLKKEPVNIVGFIRKLTKRHQLISGKKIIFFSSNTDDINAEIDTFHFENAISNLIDNAVKYGGDTIEININMVLNNIEISVADNGNGIEKNQQEKIFDKFYRIPKGNTHNVKGFGIGLYYTKKIIKKHDGIITVASNIKHTVFKVTLPV